MVRDDMPRESETATGERVVIQGVGGNVVSVPLHQISLDSVIVCGTVIVGVVDSLPMQAISMLLRNDLGGERVVPHPRMVEKLSVSEETEKIEREHPETLLPCVVTRSEAKRTEDSTTKMESEENKIIDLSQTCLSHEIGLNPMLEQTPSSNPNPREKIIDVAPVAEKSIAVEQREDDQIAPLFEKSLLEEEPNKVPSEYFIEDDILTSTSAGKITKSLTNFFSMVALPKTVQSDQGSNLQSIPTSHELLRNKDGYIEHISSPIPRSLRTVSFYTEKNNSSILSRPPERLGWRYPIPHVCCERCATRVARIQSIRTNIWTHCAWTLIHAEREMVARKSRERILTGICIPFSDPITGNLWVGTEET